MNTRVVCPLLLVGLSALASAQSVPTFSKDVAPILFKNCVSCHRPGDIAPMSLLTYDEARPWARSIREKVSLGEMPPWHAKSAHGVFANDRRLSDADKETLLRWASNGAPKGDPADLPAAPKFTEGWEIGKPDSVITMSKPYHVVADGTIAYQYFSMPTNFTEDKWVQAIEVRPGVRRVVHHILVFCREPGTPTPHQSAFSQVDPKFPGGDRALSGTRGTLIATTAPGTNAMVFEPGTAMLIKAGSTLTLQVHYTANGQPADDQSSVGLIFAKEPPKTEIYNSAFVNPMFTLPAGVADKEVDATIEFSQDSHIYALFPHTHLRGKSWEYRMVYPDGHSEVVLSVPKYDFNWQTYYIFSKPLAAPKGARLEAVAHYDNSVNNKFNPDPTKDVRWGEQTWQEMQYSGITYSVDAPPQATAQLSKDEK